MFDLCLFSNEVLCSHQGAAGVADREILAADIDSPVAFRTSERQAFKTHQLQAIRYAGQVAD